MFERSTLRTVVGTTYQVDTIPYAIFKRKEDESYPLHLAWFYKLVQLEFKISTLEAKAETTKEMVADIEVILGLCKNRTNNIRRSFEKSDDTKVS